MATRMRRNCENLLVLAGKPVVHRGSGAVSAADVFGGAVSEVEQYTRVAVAATPEVAVLGHVTRDLMHLLSALLDNATDFSSPNTKVTIRSVTTRQGDLRIEIHDCGVGMDDGEIAAANQRLAAPPQVDLATSRQMGLHVVGVLAKRHAIAVTLRANQDIDGGTTAKVVVPGKLVVPLPPQAQPVLSSTHGQQPDDHPTETAAVSLFTPVTRADLSEPTETESLVGREDLHDQDAGHAWPVVEVGTLPPRPNASEQPVATDDPTERLPIYEAILSAWFKPTAQTQEPPVSLGDPPPAATAADAPIEAEAQPGEPRQVDGATPWSSPADEGWRAVKALGHTIVAEQTAAGLPKRVPKQHLLPGSPSRPDDVVVERRPRRQPPGQLAAFTRGAHQGRHSVRTPDTALSQEAQ